MKQWFCAVTEQVPRARSLTGWFAPWWPYFIFTVCPPIASAIS